MNPFFKDLIRVTPESQNMESFYNRLEEGCAGFVDALEGLSEPQIHLLWRALRDSAFLTETLIQHPEWVQGNFLDPENLSEPSFFGSLKNELKERLMGPVADQNWDEISHVLREFKTKNLFRIALRDLNKIADAQEVIRELSDVADVCLEAVFRLAWMKLSESMGHPGYKNKAGEWEVSEFAVIALGKLGGRELNYSSDVDLIFVYSEDGKVVKGNSVGKQTNLQFFTRLAETFIEEVTKTTKDGQLYRVDLRLRPEGNKGPLVRSLSGYENYYQDWGRTWERMMLIKARCVAGSEGVASEFTDIIQPFRYPRELTSHVPDEVAGIKERIEKEVVKAGELDRNVKLGKGGIREIEFIVQTIQVMEAGEKPYLQGSQTLILLKKLSDYACLPTAETVLLSDAYKFYRNVEHRLQMTDNQQVHTIPANRLGRMRLARQMGYSDLGKFEKQLHFYQEKVRIIFERIIHKQPADQDIIQLPEGFEEQKWKLLLKEEGFKDIDTSYRLLKNFLCGPGYVHLSARTMEVGRKLLYIIFRLCPSAENLKKMSEQKSGPKMRVLSDPDRVIARLDTFIQCSGSRQGLFENWFSSSSLFELLLLLFDRSEYLAEVVIKSPNLVAELIQSPQLNRYKGTEEMLSDLKCGQNDEDQLEWLRKYHHAELTRIALRDILQMTDFKQNQEEINSLGEACTQYALKVMMRKFHLRKAPFAIIGMGKFGGRELTYGSDLDILFVCTPRWKGDHRVQKMAFTLCRLLSEQTALGRVYKTDSRLRPDGEGGTLVCTLLHYDRYYRRRAMLWEIQSLTRARVICGDVETGFHFMDMARSLTNFSIPRNKVKAYSDDWKFRIVQMRERIEKERTPIGKDRLAFKTGAGGLVDVEFLVQALNMEFGWFQPNTRKALKLAASQDLISKRDAEALIVNLDKLMNIEKILRRWSYEGESVLPDDPAPLLRVAIRCGFGSSEDFMNALDNWRKSIRKVYLNWKNSDRRDE